MVGVLQYLHEDFFAGSAHVNHCLAYRVFVYAAIF